MKLNKTMKKYLAVVLSLAMVAASVTVYKTTAKAADDIATMISSAEFNLALNRKVTTNFTFSNTENNLTNLTNGKMDAPRVYPDAKDDGGYYQIDLEKYYTVDSIDQIVTVFNETNNDTWPSKAGGYYVQYSMDGSNFTEALHVTDVTLPETAPYVVATDVSEAVVENLEAVRYVRLFYPDRYGYGVQVRQLAVLNVNNDATEAEIEMCDDAAGVTLTSDDCNSISYVIEAGEGQEDYVYNVFLDGGSQIGTKVQAGETYTINNIAEGEHTVTVISDYDGKVSKGIVSEAVNVADITSLFASTKNIASTINNEDSKIIDTTFYNEAATLERAQKAIDGNFEQGEDVAIRTAGNQDSDVIIDLGANYKASEFEQIVMGYANANTDVPEFHVAFAAVNNEADYVEVASATGYSYSGSKKADSAKFNTDNYTGSVRYIKITLTGGGNGWGYAVDEIGIILNVEAADATVIIENKTVVEAPTIVSKPYTGDVVTADIGDTEIYSVVTNEGGVDAGIYDVVLELNDIDNYYWKGDRKGTTVAKTVTFEITKAENEWTDELAIAPWKYGEEANAPVAAAKFGDVVYTYSTSEDGAYTATVPTDAGNYFVKAEVAGTDNYEGLDAVVASFTIEKADQNAPEGIETVKSTIDVNADGKITNVTDAMEYRAEGDTEYTTVSGSEINNVFAGTYYVRYAETDNYKASADTVVVVETGRKLVVNLNPGTGYVLEAVNTETNEVEYGTVYAFKLTIGEGYKKGDAFAVKINGQTVEADGEGVYTIQSVTEDIEVVVEDVVENVPDTTAPVVTDSATTPNVDTPTQPQTTTTNAAAPKKVLGRTVVKKPSKKKAAKKVKISFKKVTGAKKYTVQISTTKKFKKVLVKKTVKKAKVTIKSKKLKNKKKLYVRVRAVGAKKWSKVKKIKIKK